MSNHTECLTHRWDYDNRGCTRCGISLRDFRAFSGYTGPHAPNINFEALHIADVIREFNREHGYASADTMLVKRLRLLELSERQIAGVLTILQTICPDCWDHPKACKCYKDA